MFELFAHRFYRTAVLATCSALSACGSLNSASNRLAGIVTPYKIDIVQGNFVSREQAQALKPGMSRNQVKNILGTSLLTSIFHAERWDYVFTFKRQGLEPQSRRVTVFFKQDVLERIEAGDLPTEAEFVASLDSGRPVGPIPVLEMAPQTAPTASAPVPVPVPAQTLPPTYPPLEAPTR